MLCMLCYVHTNIFWLLSAFSNNLSHQPQPAVEYSKELVALAHTFSTNPTTTALTTAYKQAYLACEVRINLAHNTTFAPRTQARKNPTTIIITACHMCL